MAFFLFSPLFCNSNAAHVHSSHRMLTDALVVQFGSTKIKRVLSLPGSYFELVVDLKTEGQWEASSDCIVFLSSF